MSKQRADVYLETDDKTGSISIILKSHDDVERYLFVYGGMIHLLTKDELATANKELVKLEEANKAQSTLFDEPKGNWLSRILGR